MSLVAACARVVRGVVEQRSWYRHRGICAHDHSGLGWQLHVFAFLGYDVHGRADQTDHGAARDVAENQADKSARSRSQSASHDVAFDIALLFDHDAFGGFQMVALFAGIHIAGIERQNTHLHGKDAAFEFNRIENHIDGSAAADHSEPFRPGDTRDLAVNFGSGGKKQLIADQYRFGNDRGEWIAVVGDARREAICQCEMNLGSRLNGGLRVYGGREPQQDCQKCANRYESLHESSVKPLRESNSLPQRAALDVTEPSPFRGDPLARGSVRRMHRQLRYSGKGAACPKNARGCSKLQPGDRFTGALSFLLPPRGEFQGP